MHPIWLSEIFFTPDKRGVPISTTSSEPATYAILHLGAVYLAGAHVPLWLPELSQWPIKDHRGTTVSGCLPLDNPTYRLLGFENKFSPPFEFETGARIEPPVTES